MHLPKGLDSPLHIAQLILPVAIFAGICFLSIHAFMDLAAMPPG